MIGIKDLGSYVPVNKIDNLSAADNFGKPEQFIKEKIGFRVLPRITHDECTSEMCVKAFEALQGRTSVNIEEIDCLVVCTQNPDGAGLPHTAAIVQDLLGAKMETACFDISLGCSGYVYSLNIVSNFMQANNLRKGLLFTADPYSKVLAHDDYVTQLIFGDASTCTLLDDSAVYHMGKTLFSTNGKKHKAIAVAPDTGSLAMDGQDVFSFTMKKVPSQINQCLELNNMTLEKVDLILLHQASKYIIDNMTKRLGVCSSKVPFRAEETGNTVSSSLPLLLLDYFDKCPQSILMSGFGVGLSWASTVLFHSGN